MKYRTSTFIKIVTYFVIIVCFLGGVTFSFSKKNVAQGIGLPAFGGQVLWWIPCTCSPSIAIFYRPAQPSTFIGGPLAYSPIKTLTYLYYNMVTPGVWHLGDYIPGVQACWMQTATVCVPFPVLGLEAHVGTSGAPSPL